ncbi:MAG: hypothetical protein AVDCRST_MAG31-487, partial [uncultured Sphingomonas sp.]
WTTMQPPPRSSERCASRTSSRPSRSLSAQASASPKEPAGVRGR